jgi:hypothetical protein
MEHLYNLSVKNQTTNKWKNIARLYKNDRGNLFLSFLAESDVETFELLNGEFDRAVAEGKKYVNLCLFENKVYEETNAEPVATQPKTSRRQTATTTATTAGRGRTTTRVTRSTELDDEIPF